MRRLPAAALLVLAAAGCRSETPSSSPDAPATAEAPAAPAMPVDRIEIVGDDQMRFSETAFTVKAGTSVTVTLRNAGQLPKETFGHNLVLLRASADADAYATAAMGAREAGFIPADRAADVVAHTRLLGPGETDTLTFTAPTEPGTSPYLCTFPGHGSSMRGTMTVVG